MAERVHSAVSALDGVAVPRRHGRAMPTPGVVVGEMRDAGLALVTARKDRRTALLEAVRTAFGVELPCAAGRVTGGDITFVWSGPEQWLACGHPAPAGGMEAHLGAALPGLAAIVDQSHGRALLRITGSRVRDALAKGVPIDLHPRAFNPGDAAATLVSHIPVLLWQIDQAPTYDVAVARSLAQSFWHWLEASAAEYGLELKP